MLKSEKEFRSITGKKTQEFHTGGCSAEVDAMLIKKE